MSTTLLQYIRLLVILQFVKKIFCKCIDKEKRKKMFGDNTIPDMPAAHPASKF
jgi:hypothetical protein